MNRLILICNGFDLAHDLPTSYNNFMLWYVKQAFKEALYVGYDDTLLSISKTHWFDPQIINEGQIEELVDKAYRESFHNLDGLGEKMNGSTSGRPFVVTIKSTFLSILLNNCSDIRWVDIESEFYDQLKKVLDVKRINDPRASIDAKEAQLKSLNQALKCLMTKLENYLSSLLPPAYNVEYMDILTSPINEIDVHMSIIDKVNSNFTFGTEPNNTYILNFNYTSTINNYIDWFNRNSGQPIPTVNFIHGKLKDKDNPLIFGFGDEIDEDYLKMEREKAKGYFEHIKSFWYFRTSNYHDLIRFIDSGPYQTYILGHSCGLSDRTMLHMIFEHENCKSIKIFYHGDKGTNNYTSVTYEIARHFTDKAEMRNKIVSLDRSSSMPQLDH